MGVLAMLELEGDTTELLAAVDRLVLLLPAPDGLIARMVATTGAGIVLLQLWESPDARQRNADDPEHAAALEASGMRELVRTSRSKAFGDANLTLIDSQRP
jgi:hypothetical protein